MTSYVKGKRAECSTQAELDAAIKAEAFPIVCIGTGWFTARGSAHVEARGSAHVEARGSAHVVAWGSAHVEARGSAHVVAWGSAHVVAWGSAHVEAWGSAHVEARGSAHVEARGSAHVVARGSAHVEARGSAHVVAWGSAHVEARGSAHVEARGSAHVVAWGSAHVEAWESAHVVAWGSAHVEASQWNSVHKMLGHTGKIKGGVIIAQPKLKTAKDWCAYHGVTVTRGVAILYKGVNDDFTSPRGTSYAPGTKPEAADWDGGKAECGGGLHFSPSPGATLEFHAAAKRFVACPVRLADIRAPKVGDEMPQKVKARRLCGPAVEVNRLAEPVK